MCDLCTVIFVPSLTLLHYAFVFAIRTHQVKEIWKVVDTTFGILC